MYYRRLCRCSTELRAVRIHFRITVGLSQQPGQPTFFLELSEVSAKVSVSRAALIIVVKLIQQETSSWPRTLERLLTSIDSDLVFQGHPFRRYSARATDSVTCTDWHRLFHLFLHRSSNWCLFRIPAIATDSRIEWNRTQHLCHSCLHHPDSLTCGDLISSYCAPGDAGYPTY